MESLRSLKNVDFSPDLIKLDPLTPLPDLNLFLLTVNLR